MTLDQAPDVLQPKEAGQILRVGKGIYELLASGRLRAARTSPRGKYLISKQALIEFLEAEETHQPA